MLTFIGILIFMLAEVLFSDFAPEKHTNWSIFYFSASMLSFLLISLDQFLKSLSKFTRLILIIFGVFFLSIFVYELTLINMPYQEYMKSANNIYVDWIRHIFVSVSLLLLSFKYIMKWVKV